MAKTTTGKKIQRILDNVEKLLTTAQEIKKAVEDVKPQGKDKPHAG